MSFAAGFTKGFIRQSEMNQARRESEADRELAKQTREDDRNHDFELLQKRLEADNQKLITSLRAKRAAVETASGGSVNQYKALAEVLGDAEGADEYLATVARDPRVAGQILDTVTDLQSKSKRKITPAEIMQYITPIITETGETQAMVFDDELEQLMYEDALSEIEKPAPALAVSGDLYDQYTKADVELAEDNFTSAMLDLARKDVESLMSTESPEAGKINDLISEAEGGNQFAMSRLANRYGNTVIADFYQSMQDNPFLRPIVASGSYGTRIQKFDALVQSYERGELSSEVMEQLQQTYPQVFN